MVVRVAVGYLLGTNEEEAEAVTEKGHEAETLRAATATIQERLLVLEAQAEALAERLARLRVDDIDGHRELVAEQRATSQALREVLAEATRIAARQSSLLAVLKGEDDAQGTA